ncbi:hypothetical protein NVP1036O_56 [Vibrio phage 1.036.O._10N.286.45.C3]|nr:hypothetical protein NVP1036O_56 [Vibrio phage 1.036.O._10N.286.45.C3]
MKHKNAEMIIAAANNTEMVVFVKVIDQEDESGNYWAVSSLSTLVTACNEFFLCLPQHKDACLHWLNGGDVEFCDIDTWYSCDGWSKVWFGDTCGFMQEGNVIRARRKKEKRFIVYRNGTVYGEFLSIRDINDNFIRTGQIIEIEVEA